MKHHISIDGAISMCGPFGSSCVIVGPHPLLAAESSVRKYTVTSTPSWLGTSAQAAHISVQMLLMCCLCQMTTTRGYAQPTGTVGTEAGYLLDVLELVLVGVEAIGKSARNL